MILNQAIATNDFMNASATGFAYLSIDGHVVGSNSNLVYRPSGSRRKINLDNIVVPGQELEKDRYKGRSVLTIRFDFEAYDDDAALAELLTIAKMCIPPLSDTGAKLQSPKVLHVRFNSLADACVYRMICSEDDGCILFDDLKRCHKWGATFRQWAQWTGPGVIPFADINQSEGLMGATNISAPPNELSVASRNASIGDTGMSILGGQ